MIFLKVCIDFCLENNKRQGSDTTMAIRKNIRWNYREESFFPDKSFPQMGFELASIGITHPDPTYHIPRLEGVAFYVFEYIFSGKGTLRIENQTFHPQGGDVYILHPETSIEYWSDPDDPWEKIWFNIYGDLPEKLIQTYKLTNSVLFRHCPLEQNFTNALNIIRNNKKDACLEFALELHRICHKLGEHLMNVGFERKEKKALQMRDYMHEHYAKNINLNKLARLIGRTPEQALRLFKKEFGVPPMRYLQEIRLNFAKQYLLNTDYTLHAIAENVGFVREYHFAAWFKKCTGIAPGRFRHQGEF